ncbi:MAG: pyridoxamine 5'-phosphate oxidase family protein [Tessaracoccus sp.]
MTNHDAVTYFEVLDPDECLNLLLSAELGRIAWEGAAGLSVVPVNFQYKEGQIVFHTKPGTSLARLLEPSEVAFLVDDIDAEEALGWSVLVRGTTGPAPAHAQPASWLVDGRTTGIAIDPRSIDGRVVSGVRR